MTGRAVAVLLIAMAMAPFSGCSTSPEEKPMQITLLGDSLIEWGEWDGLLPGSLTNHGVAGETTEEIAGRAAAAVTGDEDAVVLWTGTNDIALGIPLEQSREHLVELLTTVRDEAPEAQVVIMAVPPLPWAQPEVDAYNAVIREEATGVGATVVDAADALAEPGARSPDGVHIEPSGYEAVARLITSALE